MKKRKIRIVDRRMWSRKLASLLLLLSLTAPWLVATDELPVTECQSEDIDCLSVWGIFLSNSVPPPECQSPAGLCTEGTLWGGLSGDYTMTINQLIPIGEPQLPFVNFYTGQSSISLFNGKELVGIDSGSLNGSPPGTVGSGKFATLLTFIEGAEGYLYIDGTFDFVTGQAYGIYKGRVCEL